MIGHARCRPGPGTGLFTGRSAIGAGASRDRPAGALGWGTGTRGALLLARLLPGFRRQRTPELHVACLEAEG